MSESLNCLVSQKGGLGKAQAWLTSQLTGLKMKKDRKLQGTSVKMEVLWEEVDVCWNMAMSGPLQSVRGEPNLQINGTMHDRQHFTTCVIRRVWYLSY